MEIRPLVRPLARRAALLVAVAGAVVAAACSTDSVASAPEMARRSEVLPPTGAVRVKVLPRKVPQGIEEKASLTITAAKGGTLSLPGAGMTLTVPAGAIRSGTLTITVTATSGASVAYEFQPHGVKFAKPLTLKQDLTKAQYQSGVTLWGGYNLETVDQAKGQVTILESVLAPVAIDRVTGKVTTSFPINHFSGYVIATGRSDDSTSTLGM